MERLWEENRKRVVQEATGTVYVLATEHMADLCKIGFTARPVEERIRELNAETGSLPFRLYAVFSVVQHEICERIAHEAVRESQIAGKELFRVLPSSAYYRIRRAINAYIRAEHVYPENGK